MICLQVKVLPVQVGPEVLDTLNDGEQVPPCHTIVLFRLGVGFAIVPDHSLIAVLNLGEHCSTSSPLVPVSIT